MNYAETIEYLKLLSEKGSIPGLERIKSLLALLGNPQDALKIIHVTGTNGKGSFCAMLSSVLRSSGYNVACFNSPYLTKVNEMFTYNSENISDSDLAIYASIIREYNGTVNATEYEFLTSLAFLYFSRLSTDVVIIECCMGGLEDTTNVISSPVLSVITSVALDHTSFLGNTISEIAFQKAGIIKKGRPILALNCPDDAEKVIRDKARDESSPCYIPRLCPSNLHFTLEGTTFDYDGLTDIRIPFSSVYQVTNAVSVVESVKILRQEGFVISEGSLRDGLSNAVWQGRFEILSSDPLIIFDGCHNVHGVQWVSETLDTLFSKNRLILVSGVMRDKDYVGISRIMSVYAQTVYTVAPDNKRALNANDYAEVYKDMGINAISCDSVRSAVNMSVTESKSTGVPVLVFGSLYLYRQIKEEVNKLMLK